MCMGGCTGGGSSKKPATRTSRVNTGSRPLAYTKKLNMPFGQPRIKSSGLKFGRS